MKDRTRRQIINTFLFLLAILFMVKFGKGSLLRTYVEIGIGDCRKIPVLCILPEEEIINSNINKRYLAGLLRYDFPEMEISMPEGFTVIKEKINKVYYKREPRKHSGSASYLLYEKPNFFVGLFPKIAKQGIKNDYEFLTRTMYATSKNINDLTDAFFVIMKSVFTPNLGDEVNVKIIKFTIGDKKGFITHSLTTKENYFDCNIINNQGDFFKVYIKDKDATLDLDKVLTIISTVDRR